MTDPVGGVGGVGDHVGIEPEREERELRTGGLEVLGTSWWSALDAAETALWAASASLSPLELRERQGRLARERASTVDLLGAVARAEGTHARFSHLLVSRANLTRLLGLPSRVTACVFNLDGVLVGSAALHAAAWTETFDELILARVERTHGLFAPFNPRTDYPQHLHGKPRLDGVRAFLASRGIRLPEGSPDDPPGAETVHGLANRKKEALLRRIDERGVEAFEGSKRYLEVAGNAGLGRAVVSASANTEMILDRAGLTNLIDECVDGNTIVAQGLRPKPAPDILVAACRLLHVSPQQAVAFETTPAGVAAARAAGFAYVVGVDSSGSDGPLSAKGVDVDVDVSGLVELLERDLSAPPTRR